MSQLQQSKLFLVEHTGLAKDALHIYVAVLVFLGCCMLFKWRVSQWKPWIAVLLVALIGEAWDIRDSLVYDTSIVPAENWKDLWNTMAVPTILVLFARSSQAFGKR